MYISELVTGIFLLGICSVVSHTFDTRKVDNESNQLLKRMENVETKQKIDGDRMRQLETDVHRQSNIIQEQNEKIKSLEETVLKQKSTVKRAFSIARHNRRNISFIRAVLLNRGLLDNDRMVTRLQGHLAPQERVHSNKASSVTVSKSGRKHGGKTDRPNTKQHSYSQTYKTVESKSHHQHLHSQTEEAGASKHHQNSYLITPHVERDHHRSHHKQNQSSYKHASNRNHPKASQIQSVSARGHHKHHGDSTIKSHAKDNQVKHQGKHPNGHNGHSTSHHAIDKQVKHQGKHPNGHNGHSTSHHAIDKQVKHQGKHPNGHNGHSTSHHAKHNKKQQDTRHDLPNKPRKQQRSVRTTRQTFGGIAFSVYLDHDATLSKHEPIKFNKVITNDGDGYDPVTGVFTCAEEGVYMLTFSIGQRDQGHYMWAELMVNSQNVIDAAVDTYHPSQDLQGGNTVIVRLRQGDKVWIDATHNGSHVEGSGTLRLSTFSGLYLYA